VSDSVDMFRSMKDMRRLERERFGIKCPVCVEKLPKAQPKILMPGQSCRAHKPGYQDPRPRLTAEQFNEGMAGTDWTQEPPR